MEKSLACVVEGNDIVSILERIFGHRWKESEQKTTHLLAISLHFRRLEARKESQRPGMEHPAKNRRTCNENPSYRSQSHHRTRRTWQHRYNSTVVSMVAAKKPQSVRDLIEILAGLMEFILESEGKRKRRIKS